MTFDAAKVPGGDVRRWGEECRAKALRGVGNQDWREIYDWTRSWVGWGGGAWLPDTWLLYAASAILHKQPKSAVHSLDLGLRIWLAGPEDRAALTWCRGLLVWSELKDPKTALLDLESWLQDAPSWAAPSPRETLEMCRQAASISRKRVPSVGPRPAFEGPKPAQSTIAPEVGRREDGSEPAVWGEISSFFLSAK